MPLWRNWQTRWTQNPVVATPCGFDSHRRHRKSSIMMILLFIFVLIINTVKICLLLGEWWTFCYNRNMIIGIGNDTESISRVGQIVTRQENFMTTILTDAERRQASERHGKHYHEFVAGRFSAKEAFSKATGYGIGAKVHWHDIEILNEENGRPVMLVKNFPYAIHVAITHSGDFVNTVVVIERLTIWERVSLKLFPKRGVLS